MTVGDLLLGAGILIFMLVVWWFSFKFFLRWKDVTDAVHGHVSRLPTPSLNQGTPRKYLVMASGALTIVVVGSFLLSRGGNSSDAISSAQSGCLNWFNSEPDVGGRDAFLDGTWEKDGHIVVDIGFNLEGSSYSSRLCVYDPASGKMTAPNNFTRSRWEK